MQDRAGCAVQDPNCKPSRAYLHNGYDDDDDYGCVGNDDGDADEHPNLGLGSVSDFD